jgi:hypothetical protein
VDLSGRVALHAGKAANGTGTGRWGGTRCLVGEAASKGGLGLCACGTSATVGWCSVAAWAAGLMSVRYASRTLAPGIGGGRHQTDRTSGR